MHKFDDIFSTCAQFAQITKIKTATGVPCACRGLFRIYFVLCVMLAAAVAMSVASYVNIVLDSIIVVIVGDCALYSLFGKH